MSVSSDIVQAFACPHGSPGARRAHLQAVCRERAVSVTSRFLSEIGAEVAERSRGLVEVLQAWLHGGARLDDAVGFPSGHLERCLRTSSVDPVRAAACVALFLHLTGWAGEWSATYREPLRLGVGRFVIARASGHRVRAGAGHLLLSPGEEGVTATELVRTPEGWRALRGESLQVVRLGVLEFPLLSGGDLDLLVPGEAFREVRADHEGVVNEWTSAVALLQRYAPPFAAWVSDIVRSVIPLEGSETTMRSSTERHRFSTVAISFRCRPVQIAEALVHESSHEYLQIAGLASPLENGTDPRAYDSPLRRALRPIGSILLAFHAVENILLFYRECLSRGFEDDGYCAAWAVRHEKQAAQMCEDLMHSPALTEAGRALVTSLTRLAALTDGQGA